MARDEGLGQDAWETEARPMICVRCGDEIPSRAASCARCGGEPGEAPASRRAELADFVKAAPRALSSVRRLFGLSTTINAPRKPE